MGANSCRGHFIRCTKFSPHNAQVFVCSIGRAIDLSAWSLYRLQSTRQQFVLLREGIFQPGKVIITAIVLYIGLKWTVETPCCPYNPDNTSQCSWTAAGCYLTSGFLWRQNIPPKGCYTRLNFDPRHLLFSIFYEPSTSRLILMQQMYSKLC